MTYNFVVMPHPQPNLYQINTRVWLYELGQDLGRPATLLDVPDAALDRIGALGFDWVWLLGVWQTGAAGRAVSLTREEWRRGYRALLPDFRDADVCGSPFAVRGYTTHADFGGDAALTNIRGRLQQRGIRLMLDFVPNHTALDHPWVFERPDFYIQRTPEDREREPHNYVTVPTRRGPAILAHGRDPYFAGWPDTLQLNYRHPEVRRAMRVELLGIAERCNGVRCDMAMLLLPEVIARTWGDRALPTDGTAPADESFWPEAIRAVRQRFPEFLFLAEVYWDLEGTLQQQGFDYTYDKALYDRLHRGDSASVRGHLHANAEYQRKSARFLENHDEQRAAAAFPPAMHPAAAVVTYLVPGLRFFHEGQLEGRLRQASLHLRRRPAEAPQPEILSFYGALLAVLKHPEVRSGRWRLLDARPAWEGNPSCAQFIAFSWETAETPRRRLLVTVNYAPRQGQCFLEWPWPAPADTAFLLSDLLSPARYERPVDDLMRRGLYLDVPAFGCHIFEVEPYAAPAR